METSPETRIGAVDTIFDPKGCQIRFSGVILGQVSALRTFFGTQFFWLFGSTMGLPSVATKVAGRMVERVATKVAIADSSWKKLFHPQ